MGRLIHEDDCPNCGGALVAEPGDCSCHISPPCNACIEAVLVCEECGFEVEYEEFSS